MTAVHMKRHQPFAYFGIGWFRPRGLCRAKKLAIDAAAAITSAVVCSARARLDLRCGYGRLTTAMAACARHAARADILSARSRQKRQARDKATAVIADVPAGGIS